MLESEVSIVLESSILLLDLAKMLRDSVAILAQEPLLLRVGGDVP